MLGAVLLLLLQAPAPAPLPPVLQGQPQIPYPPGETANATVVLELDVDPQGNVTGARVAQSGGAPFDEAALTAARAFHFAPGRFEGQPVPFQIRYTHHFHAPPRAAPRPAAPPPPPVAHLRGRLLERGTRDPLAAAQIRLPGRPPVETDAQGQFELEIPPQSATLSVSAPEHRRIEVTEHARAGESLTVTYYLERTAPTRYETVVHGQPFREEVSRQTLEGEEISKIPGSLGDTLRAVLNLPGIARAPFNSGLLIIRGGKPSDSRVYIEGSEVPQLYHFGALSSVVASDLVGRIDFLPGDFGVRYGRATAGTIDLEFREPKRDRLHGLADINILDAGAEIEGPVGEGALAIAARRSYIDAILPALLPSSADVDFTTAPRYYDYQALYDRHLGTGRLSLRLYGSDDELTFLLAHPQNVRFRGEFDTHLYFHRAQASWQGTAHGADVRLMGSVGYQRVHAAIGEGLNLDLRNASSNLRAEAEKHVLPGVRLGGGVDAQLVYLAVDATLPIPNREGEVGEPAAIRDIAQTHQQRNASAIGTFLYADIDPTRRFRVTPGVRVDYYALDSATTIDPRLQARYTLTQAVTLRGAIGLYSQPPEPQNVDPSFGNPHAGPEHSIALGVGAQQNLGAGVTLSTDFFYKSLYDLATPSSQPILDGMGGVRKEGVANQGTGNVLGGELLLRQALGKRFFGWVAYTLMRSQRQDSPDATVRLFDFDQTHVLTLALHTALPRGWEAGIRFRYVTGHPVTPYLGGLYDADADTYLPVTGAVNSGRLAAYQQLDVRIDKTFTFEKWLLTLYLDVQNVYNYDNVEGVRYSYDYSRQVPITGLPILPALGIRGKF